MNKRKVAGMEFEILTPEEELEYMKDCQHEWRPHRKEVVINPAMEYVRGYGSEFVSVIIAEGRICAKCGLFVAEKEASETSQGGLKRILQHRSYRRTICQLLRELRDEVRSKAKLDDCLMMAKRMNDKLVQQCGRGWENDWYDGEGNFNA